MLESERQGYPEHHDWLKKVEKISVLITSGTFTHSINMDYGSNIFNFSEIQFCKMSSTFFNIKRVLVKCANFDQ